jgi:hypothetical protein
MKRLIDAFEGLFIAATQSGGELAKTARFTLENVNWKEAPNRPEPTSHDIVDSYLEAACAASGPDGSSSRGVARALSAVTDQLAWRASSKCSDDGPDIDNLLRNFAITVILGEGGLLPSDKVCAGFSGNADWKVGTEPWFAVEPGDSIYHESWAHHAMQTNEQPLLTVWLWTSHLDSEVMIVGD